jgi:hypothetical protein
MLKPKAVVLTPFPKKVLEFFASLKDPGFDLYWLAAALSKVNEFPDDIRRWPVEMILDVDVTDLKRFFSELSTKVMDKIKDSKK